MKSYLRKRSQKGSKIALKSDVRDMKFDGNVCEIFNIPLFSREMFQALKIIEKKLALGTKKYWIATVNPEFVMMAEKDSNFRKILTKTDLNVMDGIGLVWARELEKKGSKNLLTAFKIGVEVLQGKYKNEVTSGADLILELARMVKEKNKKIFLLGGWGDRAEKTAKFLKSEFLISGDQIKWSEGEPRVKNNEVLKQINKFKPDVLLVAYGMKKQEFWIDENLEKMDVGLVVGVGRSFDYYSGDLKRAPAWVRKIGLEWFYSLMKEPSRFKRQLVLPGFIWKVMTS